LCIIDIDAMHIPPQTSLANLDRRTARARVRSRPAVSASRMRLLCALTSVCFWAFEVARLAG
jgi:hypothetical protein